MWPVVTAIGGRLAALFSGAVLLAIVFARPGLGRLLLASLQTPPGPAPPYCFGRLTSKEYGPPLVAPEPVNT